MADSELGIVGALSEVNRILKERGVYERVVDWIKRNHPFHVLVVGASGTGKSSLLRSLRGLDASIRREDRTEFPVHTTGKIAKEIFTFHDTPGEDEHRSRRGELFRTLASQKPLGIINVVSDGYHEGAASTAQVFRDDKVSSEFLDRMRDKEIARISEWASVLCGQGGTAAWVLTVATKADLWWTADDDQPVREYYIRGPYGAALTAAASAQDRSVVTYSAVNQLFYDRLPMSGWYSDGQRIADQAHLSAVLLELASHATV